MTAAALEVTHIAKRFGGLVALRVSTGIAINWKSPFGPIQISFAIPYVKESYDKSQIIYFSAGTGL